MSKGNALSSRQNHNRSWGMQSKALDRGMQSKALDKSMKTPPKTYLPSILLVDKSKHVGYYNFVDEQK